MVILFFGMQFSTNLLTDSELKVKLMVVFLLNLRICSKFKTTSDNRNSIDVPKMSK